jgi:hypothetical protein
VQKMRDVKDELDEEVTCRRWWRGGVSLGQQSEVGARAFFKLSVNKSV